VVVFSHGSFLDLAVHVFGVRFPVGAMQIDLEGNPPRFFV
jgi:hypothetical protein